MRDAGHESVKPGTIVRVLIDTFFARGLRQNYWRGTAMAAEIRRLFKTKNAAFRRHVIRDQARYLFNAVRPVEGDTTERARAAVNWILLAQRATPDDGVSLGYFPCERNRPPWQSSYPETTGYIITSLLAFAERYGDDAARDAALRMARWEIAVQMPSGAVQGGPVCPADEQTPAAFNTGMVLDGLCSAYAATKDPAMLAAARRAADFLTNDLDDQGYFRTNGAYVSAGEIKTYTCLCAWALFRFGVAVDAESYRQAAVRCIEAALRQQQDNGWFAHNCLTRSDAPLTHTIGYTLQGVLEVGVAADRPDFVNAARRCVDRIIPRIDARGYLPGLFYSDWEPAGFSSCLTGSAQIAVVGFRLAEITRVDIYRSAADRLVNYLKALQRIDPGAPEFSGAVSGSFPILGEYMRAGYPNWATKYYLDALLMQDRLRTDGSSATPISPRQ
jgi:hypothetical protein